MGCSPVAGLRPGLWHGYAKCADARVRRHGGRERCRPQDVPSAVFGNPATLAQFHGTQFTLGGGWVEGYPTVTRSGFLDPNENYTVTSGTEGMIGRDVYYKLWEEADFYEDIFVNQWAFAFGTQLTRGRLKDRCGYSYNTNPINDNVGNRLSGLPVLQDAIQFLQASSTGVFNQHRLTGGVGCEGFLFPNLDLDLFAGGLFEATDQFGDHTEASVAVYYLGMGLTWRYGAPVCRTAAWAKQGMNQLEVSVHEAEVASRSWDLECVCTEGLSAPWVRGRGTSSTSTAMRDGALVIADKGTEQGSYLYYSYPWGADPARTAVVEATAKVVAGKSAMIVANGVAEQEVRLYPDQITTRHAGLTYAMDTTDAFHTYRIEIQAQDIRVFVDGVLRLDGAGKLTHPASSARNAVLFGAASSSETGEASWRAIRVHSGSHLLNNVVLSVRYQ